MRSVLLYPAIGVSDRLKVIISPFLERRIPKSGLVCQSKSDRMMLWLKLVDQKWGDVPVNASDVDLE